MRKDNTDIQTKFRSEAGTYLHNGDYFAFMELENYACYCIADSIDEDVKKYSAKVAVTEAVSTFLENPKLSKRLAKRCLENAHKELLAESRDIRLESSILFIITDYKKMIYAQAGNTRLYHFRDGKIKYESHDHSLSQKLAAEGRIPVNQVEEHEERHNLYCYLGQPERFNPYVSKKILLKDSDISLLCTRGVWEKLGKAELLDVIDGASEPDQVCSEIEEFLLSNQEGKIENYTIASIFYNKIYDDSAKKKKIKKLVLMIGIPIVVIAIVVGILLFVFHKKKADKTNQMLEYLSSGIEYVEENNYSRASEEFESGMKLEKSLKLKIKDKHYKDTKLLIDYNKLAESMVDGDGAMEEEDYETAVSRYEAANERGNSIKELPAKSEDYIESKLIVAQAYQDVSDLLSVGDTQMECEDFEGATDTYQEALEKATDCDYTDGKNQATEKLSEAKTSQQDKTNAVLDAKAASTESEAEAAADAGKNDEALTLYRKAKSQYLKSSNTDKVSEIQEKIDSIKQTQTEEEEAETKEKEEKEKTNQQNAATAYEAQGDVYNDNGCYGDAINQYVLAIDAYAKADMSDSIQAVQAKIIAASSYNTSESKQKELASTYVTKAEEFVEAKSYDSAITLYQLAKEIYKDLGSTTETEKVKSRIKEINALQEAEK